ncbi:Flp family type IVb pilin [Geomonas sp. Red421]|uniref:Flp family type IVb pilin n=1 Tax=Geomonas anaerohicana TaxID=2798583 RepID=A0ABS0YFG7_9BACT|nr:Flp family type IVb pilin [Geomonas anaerohicana]
MKFQYVRLLTCLDSLKTEKGQGLVEYALILVLIAIVVIAIMTALGKETCKAFCTVNNALKQK